MTIKQRIFRTGKNRILKQNNITKIFIYTQGSGTTCTNDQNSSLRIQCCTFLHSAIFFWGERVGLSWLRQIHGYIIQSLRRSFFSFLRIPKKNVKKRIVWQVLPSSEYLVLTVFDCVTNTEGFLSAFQVWFLNCLM